LAKSATWSNRNRGENEIEESGTGFSVVRISTPCASAMNGVPSSQWLFDAWPPDFKCKQQVDENHEIACKEKPKEKEIVDN